MLHRQLFKTFLDALVDVEHAQLQIEDRLAGHGEAEVSGLDDAGVDGSNGNLKDSFTESGPVDVALAFKLRKYGVDREIFAQRVHVRPVIVQRDAARIGVPLRDQAEPILDLALLPVGGGNGGGQRRENRLGCRNGGTHHQIARVSGLLKSVVDVVARFRRGSVFGERRGQAAAFFEQAGRDRGQSGDGRVQIDFRHGCTARMRAAPSTSAYSGAGNQNPRAITISERPITG